MQTIFKPWPWETIKNLNKNQDLFKTFKIHFIKFKTFSIHENYTRWTADSKFKDFLVPLKTYFSRNPRPQNKNSPNSWNPTFSRLHTITTFLKFKGHLNSARKPLETTTQRSTKLIFKLLLKFVKFPNQSVISTAVTSNFRDFLSKPCDLSSCQTGFQPIRYQKFYNTPPNSHSFTYRQMSIKSMDFGQWRSM